MNINQITIIFLAALLGCGQNYHVRLAEERNRYEQNISEEQKHLVDQFFKGVIAIGDEFSGIDGGFYCLWKERDADIYPHLALNEKLQSSGYNITSHKDSLQYIVVSESISHKVGTYSNGGDASKIEVVISVIDLKSGTATTLKRAMGSDPPSSISSKPTSKSGAIGSHFGDDDIYYFLTNQVIKK